MQNVTESRLIGRGQGSGAGSPEEIRVTGPAGFSGQELAVYAQLIHNFHSDATANITLTNQVSGEQFLANSNRNITKLDLTRFSEVRLISRVLTNSASVNNPRLRVRYSTTFTTTLGSMSDIGTSEVAAGMGSTGISDSGWIPLAAGAKGDVFVAVTQIGGDGTADPVLGQVSVQFR